MPMKRLNWFSPLPPERTDIAHYTARVATPLTETFRVSFWTDLGVDSGTMPPNADIRRFSSSFLGDARFNRDLFSAINVYNIGNDCRFHDGIARVAQRVPGIVILHDTRLHHFVFEVSRNDTPRFSSYMTLARKLYGREGEAGARKAIETDGHAISDLAGAMPFIEIFTDNALGVICHSDESSAEVRRQSDAPILTLPLPFGPGTDAAGGRRGWTAPWRFIVFGYLNKNRRLESIIGALADWRDDQEFSLDIYGSLWDRGEVERLIERAGLKSRVTIRGFVPEPQLDRAIASAHLAFNLRYPSMGEASGGLLRSWRHATPALVTNVGWYASLPDSVVRKISVENEIQDIRAALDELVQNPTQFKDIGLSGCERLRDLHAPSRYVAEFANALGGFRSLTNRFASRRMLCNVSATTASPEERRVLLERAINRIPDIFSAVRTDPRRPAE